MKTLDDEGQEPSPVADGSLFEPSAANRADSDSDALPGGTVLGPMTATEIEEILKALASSRRLLILEWLKDPESHFPPQVHGDQEKHGVCTQFIAEKLAVSQPATSRHLKLLSQAGLVTPSPVKGWTYYRRNESNLNRFTQQLSAQL